MPVMGREEGRVGEVISDQSNDNPPRLGGRFECGVRLRLFLWLKFIADEEGGAGLNVASRFGKRKSSNATDRRRSSMRIHHRALCSSRW